MLIAGLGRYTGTQGGEVAGGDGRSHAQERFQTSIDEAADRGRLGKRSAAYPGAQSDGFRGCAVAAAVVLGGLGLVLALTTEPIVAVLPGGLLAAVLVSLWFDQRTSKKNQGFRLDLYEYGLTAVVKGQVHAVRYDSTSVLQRSIRHTGATGYTEYWYTLTDIDERDIVLRGRSDGVVKKGQFARPGEWGTAIQQGVTQEQFPKALAAINSGESLSFGKLWVSREAVGSARDSAKWAQIEEVRVIDGYIKIKMAGKWRSLGATAVTTPVVSEMPNFFVFLALAEHLRRS
ncbi:DUF6585 family protein [Streptomyces anulatus]|uniref:DUF6585 family protein n=1 Tax=Streptomyces sp. W4I9-2 TaxID=3042297 RepID=UPI0027D8D806|nr:DUF6585 family protein [Streptomyces sp. W4I9-2]